MTRVRWESDDWPFGADTRECVTCQGMGDNIQKVIDYVLAWEPSERLTLAVECERCGGRGRLVIDPRISRRAPAFHMEHV